MVRNRKVARNQKPQHPISSLPPLIRSQTRTRANQRKSPHHRHHLLRKSQTIQSSRASLVPHQKNRLREKSPHKSLKNLKRRSQSQRMLQLWVTGKSVVYAPGSPVQDPLLMYSTGENESYAPTYLRASKAVPEHCSISDNIQ